MAGPAVLIRADAVRPAPVTGRSTRRGSLVHQAAYLAPHRHPPSHQDTDYLRRNETRRSWDSSRGWFAATVASTRHRIGTDCPTDVPIVS
jgi:hypothetical protein